MDAGAAAQQPDGEVGQNLLREINNLHEAVASRDVIGQAKGILMERFKISHDEAFAMISSLSQKRNQKVRDIAARLAETGEWPPAEG